MSHSFILDEYRSPTKTVILEHKTASASSWGGYAVTTMRRFKTEEQARAHYDAEIKRGNVSRADHEKPKKNHPKIVIH